MATISSDKLVNRTSANVTNMLAGQMPGVTIIQNTGQPGADAGVLRVRGLGTMGDASAMVVVDGVESTMSSVDPNDIENISILKMQPPQPFMVYVLPMVLFLSQPKREPKDVPLYLTMDMQAGKVPHVCPIFGFLQLCSADE